MSDTKWVFEVRVRYRSDGTWWTSLGNDELMLSPERLLLLRDTLSAVVAGITSLRENDA